MARERKSTGKRVTKQPMPAAGTAKKPPTRKRKLAINQAAPGPARIHTLDVPLLSGPITRKFAMKNKSVVRTIRGDQTLEQLHEAIFAAFNRLDELLPDRWARERDAPTA